MSGPPITLPQEAIATAYAAGWSCVAVSRRFNCSQDSVIRIAREHGIRIRTERMEAFRLLVGEWNIDALIARIEAQNADDLRRGGSAFG